MNGIKYRSADEMKDSGIEWLGEIPRDWFRPKLMYYSSVTSGGTPSKENLTYWENGDIGWLNSGEINKERINNFDHTITRKGLKSSSAKLLPVDTVLVALNGQGATKGKTAILKIQSTCNQSLAGIICKKILNSEFLFYFLKSGYRHLRSLVGEEREGLSLSLIKSVHITLPKLDEQRKIANFLDIKTAQFDSIIAKKEQLIAKLEEAKKSLISEVVTGKVKIVDGQLVPRQPEEMKDSGVEWLGKIPNDWNHSKIGFQFVSYGGGTPSTDNLDYWYGEIPWVSSKDMKVDEIYDTEDHISDKGLFRSSAKKVPIGSLLIVMRSGILRNKIPVAITRTELTINQDLKAFIPKGMLRPEFLQKFIKCNEHNLLLEWRKQGATVESLEADLIDKFEIYYPDYDEQVILINWLNEKERYMNSTIEKSRNAICLYHSAKQSLISEAVTGKIDLRDWEIIEQGGAS